MNIAVVIASVGRTLTLHETVRGFREQQLRPREILLGTPGRQHVLDQTLCEEGVRWIETPIGSSVQRNWCIDQVSPETDLLAFLDDDVELHPDYFRSMEALFREHPDLIAASGVLLHDGGISTAISREAARELSRVALPMAATWFFAPRR